MAHEGNDDVKAEALKALTKVYNVKEAYLKVCGMGSFHISVPNLYPWSINEAFRVEL